ncbi:hypothetical protein [Amycolatopsis sp. CA-230715]|uniref:hypothetical protein n=1 Tax=Amycolatopsis sp. CA-230715 TaxID=2745196 RepID=UPI001C01795F|nr:hypothetical protein [Amycolatopsis sp. CA-230715]QWF79311.1 hypothetical protein HUW46_02718 [Amycolatopsis sp. CA-230715]
MTGGFSADVERGAGRAKEFDDLSRRAHAIADELDRALDGAESAWGSDAVGESFKAAHAGHAAEAAARIRALGTSLGEAGASFGESFTKLRTADEDAADRLPGAEE